MTQAPLPPTSPVEPPTRLILVTGPSGAGRTTAIRALEDAAYEAIDNLPLSLIPRLLDAPGRAHPMAIGIDVRTRDFSVDGLLDTLDRVQARGDVAAELLYLDCHPDILMRRFSETRRRHPMARADSPMDGIDRELDLLVPIRKRADHLIDTSDLTPHDLRAEVSRRFSATCASGLAISIHSFSYKRGVPRGLDMMFDCRFLRNPHWEPTLRSGTGKDPEVAAYIAEDIRFAPFLDRVLDLCDLLLPAYRDEGKSHLSIGFGCTGGQHRSVMMTERLAQGLAALNWQVSIRHRELDRAQHSAPR